MAVQHDRLKHGFCRPSPHRRGLSQLLGREPAGDGHGVRRVPVFATVGLALMMMSIDSTIVATALHALQHGLGASINWAGWTITAYALGFVLMLPVSGKLGDQFGRRRVFLWSVVVFTVASLCCGLANDIYTLIALRAVQAAGGAAFTPSATGIVVDHFGDQRDKAVGLFGSIFPVGTMIGPIFGGLLVAYWDWRGVFFVNVPIGVLLVVLCLRYVPRDGPRARAPRGAMDVTGMVLLGVGVLGTMLGIAYLGEPGSRLSSLTFLLPVILAAVFLAVFVHHVGRSAAPFIAPRLIYGTSFGVVNLVNFTFAGGIPTAVIALIPLYAANRYGLDALRSGTLLTAEGVAAVALATLGSLALRRTGYRMPLYVGCTTMAIGTLLLALHPIGMSADAWLMLDALIIGIGIGMTSPASRNAGLQLAPEDSATLAALRSMSSQIGALIAVSIATAVIAKSSDPSAAQSVLYVALALALVAVLPLVAWVPEHRGSW